MGSHTFTWEHDAKEVFVTGSFDDWKKTVQLQKEGDIFKKTVDLPAGKHQYKYVVDGNWVANESAPKEADASGIFNNVLTVAETKEEPVSTLSSAAPESTTAALAGAVPKETVAETPGVGDVPGGFPLTPAAATPGSEPQAFSVNPIPATEGLGNPVKLEAGEEVPHPSTLTSNTVDSTVKHDKEPEQEPTESVSVAPIPATAGAGNPIHLAPGEPVPDASKLTSNTIASTATTDPASYEKADAQPPQIDPVLFTPEAEREAQGGMFHLPPLSGSVIPESSLPKDVDTKVEADPPVTIQSAAPVSTTAALAGAVPLEPREVVPDTVPETVADSQEKAGVEPEAAANAEAVEDKKDVEQELKKLVPEQPATSQNTTVTDKAGEYAAIGAGGVAAAAGTVAAATYAAKDKAVDALNINGHATADNVPDVVADSQREAQVSAEAAANPEAVTEKKQVETELLAATHKNEEETPATNVPEVVAESQKEAHASPEAAANPEAVEEKKQVESELLAGANTSKVGEYAAIGAAGVATAAGAVAAATYAAKDKAVDALNAQAPAGNVPEVVAESQKEAHRSPEAAANPEAVAEKSAVESELLREVKPATEAGEPAPTTTAATSAAAPGLSEEATESKPVESVKPVDFVPVDTVKPVESSAPETSKPVESSAPVETSKPVESADEPGKLNAPASAPALPETSKPTDSRDVSPMSKQPTAKSQTEPVVTTGVESSTVAKTTGEATKDTAAASTAPSSSTAAQEAADKKKKRRSFFGKLKDKFSSK